jgi:uncharacterized protein (DUF2235 family)
MSKRIAVFMDGTWDFEHKEVPAGTVFKDESNVARLHRAAANDATRGQITFYVPGVGTDWYDKFVGGGTGLGIDVRIKRAYKFFVDKYDDGDAIYIFGFSRGAFEARSLAGMIGRVGILKRDRFKGKGPFIEDEFLGAAWEVYRDAVVHPQRAQAFKDTNSWPARVRLVGVWDTVGALGVPIAFTQDTAAVPQFHDLDLGEQIDAAYHAVALDEKRFDFKPSLWNELSKRPSQTLEQRYFTGVHSDVGGGYDDSDGLSNLPLRWMADRAAANGLTVDMTKIPAADAKWPFAKLHDSFNGPIAKRGAFVRPLALHADIDKSVQERLGCATGGCDPFPYKPANVVNPDDFDFI